MMIVIVMVSSLGPRWLMGAKTHTSSHTNLTFVVKCWLILPVLKVLVH